MMLMVSNQSYSFSLSDYGEMLLQAHHTCCALDVSCGFILAMQALSTGTDGRTEDARMAVLLQVVVDVKIGR